MQIINGVYSKRFLTIYLVMVGVLLLLFMPRERTDDSLKSSLPTVSAQITPSQIVPQWLAYTETQRVFTHHHLLDTWSFIYFYDGKCAPYCEVIFQLLHNLTVANNAQGFQAIVMTPSSIDDALLMNTEVVKLHSDPDHFAALQSFFSTHLPRPETAIFLIDPAAKWHAQFVAPFTSTQLQREYLALRANYARSE